MRFWFGVICGSVAILSGTFGCLESVTRQFSTANLRANIMDFRGFDSSIILIRRGGILRPIGDFLVDASNVSRDNLSRTIERTVRV